MNIFDEVKNRLTMREVIENYGFEPDKAGFICCPFHAEDTPSCKIRESSFHCYGCDAKGGIIEFVMMLKGYDRPIDAAKELAMIANISIDADTWKPSKPMPPTAETVTANQMRKYLKSWQDSTFRTLREIRDELDGILATYTPGNEDQRFQAALATRTEIILILEELAAPTESELITIYETKGRDINEFIAKRRRALQSSRELKAGYSNSASKSADAGTGTSSRNKAEETAAANH